MEKTNSEKLENDDNDHLERGKWCGHEYLYKFHGFWFQQTYLETTKQVLENFKPLPEDVILASFPKTGTTWLKALIHSITTRSSSSSSSSSADEKKHIINHPQELVPSLETNLYVREKNPEFLNNVGRRGRRILGTHIPYQILGDVLDSCECKIVYVTRNPKDTLVSLWHFVQKAEGVKDDPWELDVAVDQFCDGVVTFGPYYDHVLAYREESVRRPEKVFYVTYEEIKEEPESCVRRLGEFLGCPFEEGEMEVVKGIARDCSFERLSNEEVNKSTELPYGFPLPYSSFFRKGEVGDYINYLDDEMIDKIDGVTRDKFLKNGFMYGI